MRREKRGSILDLFLIFLILLCAVGGILRWRQLRMGQGLVVTSSYTVTAVAEQVDPRVTECVSVGELVYLENGTLLGRVRAKSNRQSRTMLLSNGQYTEGFWDADVYVDLWLEIDIEATQRGQTVLLGATTPLSVGTSISVRSERTDLLVKLYKFSQSNG